MCLNLESHTYDVDVVAPAGDEADDDRDGPLVLRRQRVQPSSMALNRLTHEWEPLAALKHRRSFGAVGAAAAHFF